MYYTYNYRKFIHDTGESEVVEIERKVKRSNDPLRLESVPPFGLTAGFNFGYITTKAGTFFIDTRILGDLGVITQRVTPQSERPFLYRGKLSFSLGYEFGFVNR